MHLQICRRCTNFTPALWDTAEVLDRLRSVSWHNEGRLRGMNTGNGQQASEERVLHVVVITTCVGPMLTE